MPDLVGSNQSRRPLPGRRAELDLIARELDQARDGEPRFIMLAGEAGVGKTRLLREAMHAADDMLPLELSLRSDRIGVDHLLDDWFSPLLHRRLGHLNLRDLAFAAAIYPRLAELSPVANLPIPTNVSPGRAMGAICRLLADAADQRPLLLLLDDLPQLQLDARRFVAELASSLIDAPLAYLATARTELADPLTDRALAPLIDLHLFRRIDVAPLDESGLWEMTTAELDAHIAPALVPWLLTKSRGNPLFASELLRALQSQRILRRNPATGEWTLVKRLEDLRLPETLGRLMERRRRRLPPELARFLPGLALLGAETPTQVLARGMLIDESTVDDYRTRLEELGILERVAGSYGFAHPLMGEQWVRNIGPEDRRTLAGRSLAAVIADIEQRPGHQQGLVDGSCRTGLETANSGEIGRLLSFATVAGRPDLQALAAIDLSRRCLIGRRPREAAAWARKAVGQLPKIEDQTHRRWLSSQVDLLMGSALYLAGRLQSAERRLRRFLSAPESLDADHGRMAFTYLGFLLSKESRFDEARATYEAAFEAFSRPELEPISSLVIRCGFINHLTLSEIKRGDFPTAGALVDRGARMLGDPPPPEAGRALAQVLSNRALLSSTRGEYQRTVADHERVLELTKQHVPHAVASAQKNLALSLVMVGELPRARALILDALPKVSADDRSGRASAVYALGYVREACGEWLEAAAAYEQCVRLCEQIGNLGLRTAAVVGLMGTYESTGDRERSDQIWVELLAYLQDPTLQSHHCSPIYLVRATVLAHRHDWEGVIYIVSENFAPIAHSCSPRDRFAFDILAVRAELGCMTGNLQSESQRNVPPDLLAGWVARLDAIEPYFRRERLLDHLIDIDRTRLHLALAGWEATPREELLSEILQFLTAMGAPARLAEVVDEFTGTAIAELPLFKHAFVPARSRPKPRFDAQVQDAAVPQVPAEDSEALRIFTFGKLRVIPPHHTAPLTRADWQGSRKARLLLAYLLATDLKSRGVSRDQIFEAVWSEAENWDLTNSFQIALNRLRRALRSDDSESATKYVVYNDDTYRLVEAGVWCDARVFDRHLDAADALERQGRAKDAIRSRRAAFELYDGPFLGDFEENWAQSRQEDYCKRFAKVGITLAESAFASGKLDEVEQIAERMITANSQGEDGHRLLIRVYHKTGRHQDALRQFKRCRDIFTEMPPVNAIADLEAWLDQSTGDFDTRPESRRDPRRRSS